MKSFGGQNTHIIEDTNPAQIMLRLKALGVGAGHFTNGTYVAPQDVVAPTTLAGFKFALDKFGAEGDAILVAVNSNASMNLIHDAKNSSAEDRAKTEDQEARAHKLTGPLSEQFPDRKVIILFYDEETPEALYTALSTSGFGMKVLFKFGYGTNPDSPRIEGAKVFENVIAYPFLNDTKALCHDITVAEDQSAFVKVFNLREEGYMNFIDGQNVLLFPLAPSLQKYKPISRDSSDPDFVPKS